MFTYELPPTALASLMLYGTGMFGSVADVGRSTHRCASVSFAVQICTFVWFAATAEVASIMHVLLLPAPKATTAHLTLPMLVVPYCFTAHRWARVSLSWYSCTLVPLTVTPPPVTSTYFPLPMFRMLHPSPSSVT